MTGCVLAAKKLIDIILNNVLSRTMAVVTLLAAGLVLSASVEAVPLFPLHTGYAFDHPRVLVQQRLFGLAHGVTLLAAACVNEPAYHEPLTLAYTEWKEQQAATIDTSVNDLARYYFGEHAVEATRLDVSRALKLKDRLTLKPGSKELSAACDTFAEAIKKPLFDLRSQYLLLFLAQRVDIATTIETEVDACHSLLSVADVVQLDEALVLWHAAYGAGVDQAKTTLEQHWPESRIEATLADSLAQAREIGKRRAVAEHCKSLSQWLLSKQADPDDAFNRAP